MRSSVAAAAAAAAATARDYDAALAKLNLLASNRAITALFETPAARHADPASPPSPSSRDLNAQAIPEMQTWLRRAGYTPDDLATMRHIHVAGTKGKGSVCAFATALLRAATTTTAAAAADRRRRPVGTYTSPHLVSPRERIAIDGEPISQAVFAAAFWQLWERFTAAARAEGRPRDEAEGPASKPFYFRFLTIMAWHVFLQAGVRDVVMECGIGGEYDATNVLPPQAVSAAVVSQLGVDHVAMLGSTVGEIAWHKAGIFKAGATAFALGLRGGGGGAKAEAEAAAVMDVLRRRAAERGAELVEVDEAAVDAWAGVEGAALRGAFQKRNQALAVLAVQQHLGVRDAAASTAESLARLPEETLQALRGATLRGRCEVVDDEAHNVQWMLDGAHTRESIEQVAAWLAESVAADDDDKEAADVTLVFNQQERDAPALLTCLLDAVAEATNGRRVVVFSRALFTRNEQAVEDHDGDVSVQRALAETMRMLAPRCNVSVFDNVQSAVAEVRRTAAAAAAGRGRKQKVLVTGSLHLVGGIMRAIEPDSLL
ncbi:folylpolyglutamate synthase [Beauveria bassiana ARSEF 2860]|uniref:Folylpolyglutamate synthase n=1 Tax=Beauveria bassiana (strain ARSEF 2860) TaxID=655819 RepID=J5K6T4_BEAB2|nr:folylpolyglutamate synthase [Beauveria bassiana ARSEF 2860]EJP69786.1 folylpolyglutamate synthase [Beauveria bassiana ARSEF 2860]